MKIKKLLSVLLLFMMVLPLPCHAANDGDYAVGYMRYTIKDGMATITHCDRFLTGELTIPAELSGCPVVAIGDNAFARSQLTKITIPDSITSVGRASFLGAWIEEVIGADHLTSIGAYAFAFSSLRSIALPPAMTEIPEGLFMRAGFYDPTILYLPDTITRIGDFAFYGTANFSILTLPSSLREIGDAAFAGISPQNWTELVLPEGLVSIGDGAFWKTLSIKSLTLPSTLEVCGSGKLPAFYGTNIETVSFSEGITALPHPMFLSCHNLKSVILPDSLSALSEDEFSFPNSLVTGHEDPFMYRGWNYYDGTDDYVGAEFTPHTYDDMQKNPRLYLFASPDSYASDFAAKKGIPCSLKEEYARTKTQQEGDYAYRVYGGRAEIVGYTGAGGDVEFPATLGGYPVYAINEYAMQNNDTLRFVILPQTLSVIRQGAFSYCDALESVTLTGKNVCIENDVFWNCEKLREVIGFENASSVGESCFAGCKALHALPILPSSMTKIPNYFARNTGLATISLPSHIEEIGEGAFSNCDALSLVTLPETLTSIARSAFSNCLSLQTIIIPDSVTTLGIEAFHGCDMLRHVKVGSGITALGNEYSLGVFTFCPALETVILPDTLTFINQYEFYDGHYSRYMQRSYIERPKTLTIFANQDSYAADFANRQYISRMPLIIVLLNGKVIEFDALPIIRESRTLVPFRPIFQALGATVLWDQETKTVTATRDEITLKLTIGDATLYKNNTPIPLEAAPELREDRTYVPLRAISAAFGCDVTWTDAVKAAAITDK